MYRIKPMEWEKCRNNHYRSLVILGRYDIFYTEEHGWILDIPEFARSERRVSWHKSLDEAKTAAWADYAHRISIDLLNDPLVEQLAEALEPFFGAYDAYTNVMRNTITGGGTLTEQRFSAGERQEEAEERAHEALCGITFDQLSAVAEALAAFKASKGE